ncbi:MAG: Rne/Rng family ribonuclease [Elusimicrobia bacterium]|nr:Rne/Rng family ribonuclease [Elusimicrobiota bacterium]
MTNEDKDLTQTTPPATADAASAASPAEPASAPAQPPAAAPEVPEDTGSQREELYPRADAVIASEPEPDYGTAPETVEGEDEEIIIDEAGEDDELGPEAEDAAPLPGAENASPSGTARPDAPSAPPPPAAQPQQPPAQQPRHEGRGRRRGRGGRGGEHGRQEQGRQEQGRQGPGRQEPGRQEHGRQERQRPERDRPEHDRRGGEGHRGRSERGGEREYRSDHRGPGPAVKRELLANTNFEETRIAILENGRMAELLWERKSSQNIVGNIYKGVVENVLPGISSAFVNIGFEKNAYLYISDVLGEKGAAIDATLKKGQHIMIQVAKEAISTKGAKVTMDVSLPGRYLVFTPFQGYVGISKQIGDAAERARLSAIVDRLVAEHLGGKGVVVRTEAEGATEADLEREVKYLAQSWAQIQKKFESDPPPGLLHKDLDLALQVARDLLSDKVYVYLLDNKDQHKNVTEFVEAISPELKEKVKLYDAKTPMFKAFGLEGEIEDMRRTKVPLPNGGSIIIQEAESLCAIDVNTGRFTGSKSQEETVTVTNIEAAHEVAHQLRLRNIGGIIVVDFIDMRKASNRQKVMEAFAHASKGDRAKIRILPITRLGLVELTRERKRESTVSLITDECPQCKGCGRVLSGETLRIRIQREIKQMTGGRPGGQVRLLLHPGLAEQFRGQQVSIEKNVARTVKIQSDPSLPWEEYRIVLE